MRTSRLSRMVRFGVRQPCCRFAFVAFAFRGFLVCLALARHSSLATRHFFTKAVQ
jgi:hypothetical protein